MIVAGVGGMGSAAAAHLAERGMTVLGLDRYGIPNDMGSSHGASRIIRLAYFEDPAYVPLLRRSYELWRELELRAGRQLLQMTGCLDVGAPGTRVFEGAVRSSREHGLRHEVLSAEELMRRFPAYRLPESCNGLLEPEGGILFPEQCITAHADWARSAGAELRPGEAITSWKQVGKTVHVTSEGGDYEAGQLVVSAGSWAGKLVPALGPHLQPERQVTAWLQPLQPDLFEPPAFPVFVMEVPEGMFYGFPLGIEGPRGFKFGRFHHLHQAVDPDRLDRRPGPADEGLLRSYATRYFPAGAGATVEMKVCMFTNTPDEHFIIDRHPEESAVVVAAGFSGHGFKFCSVVGEIIADLVTEGQSRHDIGLFRLSGGRGTK